MSPPAGGAAARAQLAEVRAAAPHQQVRGSPQWGPSCARRQCYKPSWLRTGLLPPTSKPGAAPEQGPCCPWRQRCQDGRSKPGAAPERGPSCAQHQRCQGQDSRPPAGPLLPRSPVSPKKQKETSPSASVMVVVPCRKVLSLLFTSCSVEIELVVFLLQDKSWSWAHT